MTELRRLLRTKAWIGKIISIEQNVATVTSRFGSEKVLLPSTSTDARFSVGDEVLVRDGNVQGRVAREEDVPVYRV